jgi:predicted MPP superfamily phosphohydrolase
MAQISDLHVGASIKADYVAKVVQRVMDLEPDLIVLTGDLGDGNVFELQKDLEPLRRLRAPHGVFYVAGNHEYYWNVRAWMAKMKELGFTVLENDGRWLPKAKLWVGGVPDFTAHKMEPNGASDPARAFPREKVNGPSLLLAHQPKSIVAAAAAGFDMMVCGHTHSGQFFPANLLVRFFNPYHHGLHRHENTWIYVNAGTGFWGPPLRLFVPPEITLFRLEPESRVTVG